jgi:hypothetical protein
MPLAPSTVKMPTFLAAPAARPIGLKMKNPEAPAVKREAEKDWGKEKWR